MDNPNPTLRILTLANQTLHVTGYEGFVQEEISLPVGTRIVPGESNFVDVALLDLTKDPARQAMVYLGLTRASRDFTCYLKQDGEKSILILGLYRGSGVEPEPLEKQYGDVGTFRDSGHLLIWQYQIDKMFPFSAAHARLQPLVEGAAFAGDIFQFKYQLPKMVIGAIVRAADGTFASTVLGWGDANVSCVPDEQTLIPLGSITKAFAGHLLARMVAKGEARFTEQVVENPAIRFIDLVTHTSGLPREITPNIGLEAPKPELLPSVLFPPGTGALYSNVGFNVLSRALFDQCHTSKSASYGDLLNQEVLAPLQLGHTSFTEPPWKKGSSDDRGQNLFGGYMPDGKPWPRGQHDSTPRGASGLYSTPEDLLRWLQWHLETGGNPDRLDAETRLLDHATYVQRDGLHPVLGLDESGHMDAMGLGWVVMMPRGDRPFILQKAGATTGVFNYLAFSPVRGVGFFMSLDRFDVGAATEMPQMINDLIASAAPR
ncbi:serine hydrolase [Corallococcus carmarthensis]|uniref:serine hydrolase n=1 Tax=Corallococcus carmarthensis TaxID=2316728 RepID=UPI00148DE28F|nr:serine hydrolase [Corallococcus carmarthensis]NOK15885.1 serine hydrolase [Corallococcus carmarthensis]